MISEGKVRKWCRNFTNGRSNVHDKEHSGRPNLFSQPHYNMHDCNCKAQISQSVCKVGTNKMLTDQLKLQRIPKLYELLCRGTRETRAVVGKLLRS